MPSIADIVREHGPAYLERFGDGVLPSHLRALIDIASCQTPAMGGRLLECDDCGHRRYVYHCCRNRACPRCHARQTAEWTAARAGEVLPVRYHHLVFTLPAELREPARRSQKVLLGALMGAAVEALHVLARDPRFAGGRLAVLAVLHTHTRALIWHPHVHLLVPGIAVTEARGVCRISDHFLLSVRALSPIFRAKFAARVRRGLPGFDMPGAVWRKCWVVYSRPCVEGVQAVLDYLARYVCRGPLSDHAIMSADDRHVTFRYTDNDTRETRLVTLAPEEFLRRYLQHTLPQGFHRVRYYGLWAPANRTILRTLQFTLAASTRPRPEPPPPAVSRPPPEPAGPKPCPACGSVHWSVIESIARDVTVLRAHLRGPPV